MTRQQRSGTRCCGSISASFATASTSGRCARTRPPARSLLVLAAAALIIAACGRDAADPEAEIEATIGSARELARAGDAPGLAAMIAPDYADDEGRNRRLMALTLRALLGRYPRHLALVDDLEIRVISPELATAGMTVSLVGRDGSRPLSRGLDADRVRLDLALRRAGEDWLVTRASWGSRRQDIGPSGD